ncbi:MAG TPA: hypothetical protein VE955_00970 [Candidatus Dormibacteraeota bacterium]|nr:hypothetical protein [Candidatus Dormibacteraeota bacterium]
METFHNQLCPQCGRAELVVYFASNSGERIGAWCQNCELYGYFNDGRLVAVMDHS